MERKVGRKGERSDPKRRRRRRRIRRAKIRTRTRGRQRSRSRSAWKGKKLLRRRRKRKRSRRKKRLPKERISKKKPKLRRRLKHFLIFFVHCFFVYTREVVGQLTSKILDIGAREETSKNLPLGVEGPCRGGAQEARPTENHLERPQGTTPFAPESQGHFTICDRQL